MCRDSLRHILSIDVGTTSVKLCLFDRSLALVASASAGYDLDTAGGRTEADPALYLEAIRRCTDQLPDLSGVAAIGLTTQGETLIPVDPAGRPLSRAIVWLDDRAQRQAEVLREKIDSQTFYESTGLPELSGALPLSKLLWIKEQEPELYRRTHQFLLLEDYLIHWLTGRFCTEKSLLTSTGYFHLGRDDYWQELLELAGLDRRKLPPALECGTPAGTILPDRAALLGLPETAAVVTGAMDQTAAALAAGCTGPHVITETTGTAMVAAAYTRQPVFLPDHHLTVYRHCTGGACLYLPISNTAGMALKWLGQTMFSREAAEGGLYARMDREAAAVPPGSEGLLFLPYLSGAADPYNDPDAAGVFWGARLSTTRGHFARSVLEAVAFQLRDFLTMLERRGCRVEEVCSMGGGAASPLWLQIKADVCGLPIRTLGTGETTSCGAAILAAKAVGWSAERPAALEGGKTYFPNPDHTAVYTRQYRRFSRLYQLLKPMSHSEDEEGGSL